MPSQLDNLAAVDFATAFREVTQTVIRWPGGQEDRGANVEGAIVELDSSVAKDRGGLIDNERGQYLEFDSLLELPAAQETTMYDKWVIDGEVYHQVGEAIGKDGGSQTIRLLKRRGQKGREPRVTSQQRR
jgi:hypothetical protein